MRVALRLTLLLASTVTLAFAGVFVVSKPGHRDSIQHLLSGSKNGDLSTADSDDLTGVNGGNTAFPMFSAGGFETGGFPTAGRFTGPVEDRHSLDQVRESIRQRVRRGKEALTAEIRAASSSGVDDEMRVFRAQGSLALLALYEGNLDEAAAWTQKAMTETVGLGAGMRVNLEAMLGVIQMRRGETENCLDCLGPSSCIFPLAGEAVHQRKSGSRAAIEHYTAYLNQRPEDLGVRWLLNIAYMTLGEYPDKVPPKFRLPLEPFLSKVDVGRFENVAPLVGLSTRGLNMAGGSVFDDFNGDGRPDILTVSLDLDLGGALFVNQGDGNFADQSNESGLARQPYSVQAVQADYDNDGDLDVLLVRGGWEAPCPMTLLRNKSNGVFDDVTVASGLGEPIASHAAAWGDFDNDGHVDLFVCGEYSVKNDFDSLTANLSLSDPRNGCRLYRNQGDGTFVDVGERAGVQNYGYTKGACWGDYDNDGRVDLFVSNRGAENRLYHNNGDGSFTDVAPSLGLLGPKGNFACWFWDFDNDGRLDIYVNQYAGTIYDVVATTLGQGRRVDPDNHPWIFRNLGSKGFRDVSRELGLNRVALAMGSSFGDIDNDGFLDIYIGTGQPGYSALVPNILYKNMAGRRFEDVTASSGTGHLQKGHGVSFADFDEDGDLDLFVQTGGAVPGDKAANLLFRNPGHKRHWLKLKLIGTRSNRSAFGARIAVDLAGPDGQTRTVHRQIGGGSSFGGNSLTELIGLDQAATIKAITVTWPVSHSRQVFRNVAADRTLEIREGDDSLRVSHAADVANPPT